MALAGRFVSSDLPAQTDISNPLCSDYIYPSQLRPSASCSPSPPGSVRRFAKQLHSTGNGSWAITAARGKIYIAEICGGDEQGTGLRLAIFPHIFPGLATLRINHSQAEIAAATYQACG